MIMSHEFFSCVNWKDLVAKRKCANYVPEKPRYSMQDYLEVVTSTEFTQAQIEEIYNGDDETS